MARMLVGYARCSTDSQDLTAQRNALTALGVKANRIYVDHGLTGTNRDGGSAPSCVVELRRQGARLVRTAFGHGNARRALDQRVEPRRPAQGPSRPQADSSGTKWIRHPALGDMELHHVVLQVADAPDQKLVTFAPSEADRDRIAQLLDGDHRA